MRITRRILAIAAALFVLSELIFLVGIQFPKGHNFDEYHYVPAAKQLLKLQGSRKLEHPPLGKALIATSIALDEDRPFGWRWMSAFFGGLTLVGLFGWALILFRDVRIAVAVGLITLFNQLLYVQSRIAMLDTFLAAFVVWGLLYFTDSLRPGMPRRRIRKSLTWSGVFFGLALSVKWFALAPWLACIGLYLVVRCFRHWGVEFRAPSAWSGHLKGFQEWYTPQTWSNLRPKTFWLHFVALPIAIYFATFLPLLLLEAPEHSFVSLFTTLQREIWESQSQLRQTHPYASHWLQWPLLLKPIWYAFDKEGSSTSGFVRGVLMIGNPLVMWAGLGAAGFCLWAWIARRSFQGMIIGLMYLTLWLAWAVVPKQSLFYYYYYCAGLMLGPALGFVFHWLRDAHPKTARWAPWAFTAAAALMFGYFYPILSGLRIPADSFKHWMWFPSWI